MSSQQGWSTGKIVLIGSLVLVGLGLLCCGGFVTYGYVRAKSLVTKVNNMTAQERADYLHREIGGVTDEHEAVVESFLVSLRDGDLASAYASTSSGFKSAVTLEGLGGLQRAVDRVMGAYQGSELSSVNRRVDTGSGDTFNLGYSGTYELGPATIEMILKEAPDGSFKVHGYKVNSPRFLNALTEVDEDK